jgi:hypothetical protein
MLETALHTSNLRDKIQLSTDAATSAYEQALDFDPFADIARQPSSVYIRHKPAVRLTPNLGIILWPH